MIITSCFFYISESSELETAEGNFLEEFFKNLCNKILKDERDNFSARNFMLSNNDFCLYLVSVGTELGIFDFFRYFYNKLSRIEITFYKELYILSTTENLFLPAMRKSRSCRHEKGVTEVFDFFKNLKNILLTLSCSQL